MYVVSEYFVEIEEGPPHKEKGETWPNENAETAKSPTSAACLFYIFSSVLAWTM